MTSEMVGTAALVAVGEGVWRIRNRGFASNTYVCRLERQDRCIVIDPGLDTESIEAGMESLGLIPEAIFCTHGHFDHLGSAAVLQQRYGAAVHLHVADVKVANSANFTMMIARVEGRVTVPKIDVIATDGSRYLSGRDEVTFVHTPGHTPGSCCIRFSDYAFTGDTLYRDAVGLTNFPGEDGPQLLASINMLWDLLPDSAIISPGHGGAGRFEDLKRDNLPLRELLNLTPASDGD